MKLKLKNTPEQVELIKAMVSNDKLKALEARSAFAALIGPVVLQVLDKMGTTNMIFESMPFNEDTDPEIALDLYYDKAVNEVQVYHAGVGGSAPTSEVSGMKTLKLHWTEIESAVSLNKRYIERNNLNTVSMALNRMTQEILRKKELLAWSTIMRALGESRSNGADHLVATTIASVIKPEDFNQLIILSKRINAAFDSGTPDVVYSNGATDLFLSPEAMGLIREMAYNPVNNREGPLTTSGSSVIAAPESVRAQLWGASGITEFFGKTLHELNELGTSRVYNGFFQAYTPTGVVSGGGNFATANDEIIVGIDMSKGALVSPIAQNAETGETLVINNDDTFDFSRIKKVGWYGGQQQGFAVIDGRALVGLVV